MPFCNARGTARVSASSQHHVVCPHLGQYSVTGLSRSARDPDEREGGDRDERALAPEFSALRVGCQSHDTIVLAGRVSDQSRGEHCALNSEH